MAGDLWKLGLTADQLSAQPDQYGGVPMGAAQDPRRAKDIGDAILAGFQSSATILALRGKKPAVELDEEAPWYHRFASGAANVVSDLPLSVVGAVGGAAAGSFGGPVGSLLGAGAGGFAAPMALRDALMEAYSYNHAVSWADAWEIAKAGLTGGAKGAVIGAATLGAGRAVAPLVKGGAVARGTAVAGTELATMTTLAAGLDGRMPTAQEFLDNALLLGGLKGAVHVATKLRAVYAETGKRPEEVLAEANADPALKAELTAPPVKAYHGTKNLDTELATFVDAGKSPDLGVHFSVLRETAEVFAKDGGSPGKVLEAELHLNKVLDMPDMAGWDAGNVANWLDANGFTKHKADAKGNLGELASRVLAETFGKPPAESIARGHQIVRDFLLERGYDAIRYKNMFEGPKGADSYLVLDPKKINRPGSAIPSAYRELSTEQRIQAALDRDARPEAIRELMIGSKDPAELGRPLKTGDPVDYSYITDSDTLRGVLPAVEKMFEREITTQTRGEVANKAAAADAIRRIAAGDVAQHIIGTAENSSQILARGMLLRGASERAFNELRQHAGKSEADLTLTDKLGSLAAIEQLGMFLTEFRGVRAEAGRALQIFKALKRDPSLVADAEAIVKLYERKGSLTEIAQMVAQLKDPTQMQKFAESYQKATTMEMGIEGWKAAILSGPLTHLANLLGNGMKWTLDIPESMISASLLAAGRALKGDPLSMAQWKARAFAPLYGLQHGAVEAVHVAAEVWRGKGERLEKADVYRTALPGTAGEVIRLPFKALQIEDALFRTVAERSRAHTMAVDRAVKEGYDLRTREGREAVAQYTERPDFGLSEKAGAEAVAAVQQAGAEAVFSQRLGPRMEIAQRAIAGHWTQFIVPFVRTPANLVSWAIQHTPGLNLLSGRWRADFAAGGERQAQAIARVTIGTGLAMWAYSQAADGLLTGGGLFDPETRRTKAAAGWQPYSVKVGDTYYSYQRLEPLAKVLGLAADLVELSNRSTKEEDKAKIATMLILMFGNATISTTYLSGLANATQALLDPARHAGGLLEQYASSFVPKIIGQATQLADPYKREVDGVVDAIQSQIPFLREKLLPKRDVWGEPMKNERLFEVLPLAASAETTEKVKSEAMRLAIGIQDAPRFVMEAGPFNPKDKRMKLEPEQRDIMREVSGKTAMSLLSPIVNSPDWARIPDFAKIEIYRDILKGAREQGEYAALPPDSAARMALRQKIADRVLREAQAAQGQ